MFNCVFCIEMIPLGREATDEILTDMPEALILPSGERSCLQTVKNNG